MKKIVSMLLALTLILASFTIVSAAEPFADRDTLNVVYLGGSITNGGQTSDCWVSLIGNKLKERFPNKNVNNFNAGVGGTGSDFGLFRLSNDVISHDPDMVFVEFAVNDRTTAEDVTLRHMEGIVRQLMALPKKPVIVFVYTALADVKYPGERADNYVVTPPYPCFETHEKLAQYYNIPSINLQTYLWQEVIPNKDKFPGVENVHSMLPDAVHPNTLGNKIYADYIWDCMSKNESKFFALPTPNEKSMTGYEYTKTQIIPAAAGEFTGDWTKSPTNQIIRSPYKVESTDANATATYKFSGSSFYLMVEQKPTGGKFTYSIDGGEPKQINAQSTTPVVGTPVYLKDLENKEHTVVFKNTAEGSAMNIAGIGVDQPTDVKTYKLYDKFVSGYKGDGILYLLTDENCEQSSGWNGGSSILGVMGTPTQYATTGTDAYVKWTVKDKGTFDVSVFKVCHPTAGTKNLIVEVKHKDGTFKSEKIDCVAETKESGFVKVGTFSFTGDGSEYVKMYLAENDGKFLRADSIKLVDINKPQTPALADEVAFSNVTKLAHTIEATVSNGTSKSYDNAKIVCAVFDGGSLYEIQSVNAAIKSGESSKQTFIFTNFIEEMTVKFFIWDANDKSQTIN